MGGEGEEFGGGFAGGFGGAVVVGEVAEGGDGCGAGFGKFEAAPGGADLFDSGEVSLRFGGGQEGGDVGDAEAQLGGDVGDGVHGVLEGGEEGIEEGGGG